LKDGKFSSSIAAVKSELDLWLPIQIFATLETVLKIGKYLPEFDKPTLSSRAASKELMMVMIILAAG